jgi:CRISPR-associated protein Cmr6
MPDCDYVPLMFQAQVYGRSQIQRLIPGQGRNQQAYDWAEQWIQACDRRNIPMFDAHIQTREFVFTWRMVTNGGQDDGVIRPVIGERGWPYFPGSSMKGAFLRACKRLCSPAQVLSFCGGLGNDGELHPGILRFHGGYPKNAGWLNDSLVDVVHPQEEWQTKNSQGHSAFIQLSLYKPTFIFGISAAEELGDDEWKTVWKVWQAALEQGIGSRVSAGYGQIATHSGNQLVRFSLFGEGSASKLINGRGEFRPNLFKAALRGHTRRLFTGITSEHTADRLTKLLWGGIGQGSEATVGLLGIAFHAPALALEEWQSPIHRNNLVPIYDTGDAVLDVLLMKTDLSDAQTRELKQFVTRLMKFAMLLGGFGRSWRRAYHDIFLPDYEKQKIGCHWEFSQRSYSLYIPFDDDLATLSQFLNTVHDSTKTLSWLQNQQTGQPAAGVREAWFQGNVQVWGRLAEDELDSEAIHWFHGPYQPGRTIKQSALTGRMGRIGRIWHRMYPRFRRTQNSEGNSIWTPTDNYAELLTIFPRGVGNDQETVNRFLQFLDQETEFKQLW